METSKKKSSITFFAGLLFFVVCVCLPHKSVGRESTTRHPSVRDSLRHSVPHKQHLISGLLHRRCLRTPAIPTGQAVPLRPPPMVTVPMKSRAEPKARWVMFCAVHILRRMHAVTLFSWRRAHAVAFFCVSRRLPYVSKKYDFEAHITNE